MGSALDDVGATITGINSDDALVPAGPACSAVAVMPPKM
jgi:hypothetical protein